MTQPPTPPGGIDCTAAARQLYDYLDGELDAGVARPVRAHIEGCPECFSHAVFTTDLLAALGRLRPVDGADAALRRRVMDALRAAGYVPTP
jgi:anti-sigma factor (TIGR02949 family)